MFLTADQLVVLTGYKVPKKQAEWLTRNGVRHWIAKTGRPVVPVSAVDGIRPQAQDLEPFEIGHVA